MDIHSGRVDLIECKWSEQADRRAVTSISKVQENLRKSRTYRLGDGKIITRTDMPHRLGCAQVLNPNHEFIDNRFLTNGSKQGADQ